MTVILWLRRDLRIHDNPALRAALATGAVVVPLFVFDPGLLRGRHRSGPRTQFLLECLADLDGALRRRGSGLVVRHGPAERVVCELARELDAAAVFWTADVSPFAARRDSAVSRRLAGLEVEAHALPGLFVVDDPRELRAAGGGSYTVFTPFHRSWLGWPRRDLQPTPRALPPLPARLDRGALPTLADLGLEQRVAEPAPGGESPGRDAMQRFLAARVVEYDQARDDLARPATSRLSPYLHFGCVSARELEQRLGPSAGEQSFRRQLCWRDFYAHVLAGFPDNADQEFQERLRGTIRWSRAPRRLEAWRDGRTGYPLVDAAMRQLRREGWMHNRARLVVGSFLTKDLGIDWRWGERWFMRMLLDGDEANNNGNWQWVASVGVDPQPPFRRIYNPTRQQARFDPNGAYVRRYVPELRAVPDRYLSEPWTMPDEVQRQAGCVLGKDYPRPLVEHGAARRAALARYAQAGSPSQPARPRG